MTSVVKDRYSFFHISCLQDGSDSQGIIADSLQPYDHFQMDQPDFVKRLFAVTPGEVNDGMSVLSQTHSVLPHDKLTGYIG